MRKILGFAGAALLAFSLEANAAVFGPEVGNGATDFVDVAARVKVGYYDPETGELVLSGAVNSNPLTESGVFGEVFDYDDVVFWDKRENSSGLGQEGAAQVDIGSQTAGSSVTVDVNGTLNTFTVGSDYRGNWFVDGGTDLDPAAVLGFAVKTGNNTAFIDIGGPNAISFADLVVFNTVGYYFERVAEALFNVNNGDLEYVEKVKGKYQVFTETFTELTAFTDKFMDVYFDGNNDQGFSHLTVFGSETTPVPVPAAFPLLGAALLGLGILARRRKSKA